MLRTAIFCMVLGLASAASAFAEGAADTNAAPAAAPAPTVPAPASSPASTGVLFGIITLAADRHSFTMPDGKGGTLKLAITAKTEITKDLKKIDASALAIDKALRVTFTGNVADSIDQLSPEKKKKKKV